MFPTGLFILFAICGFFILIGVLITYKRRHSLRLSTKSPVKRSLLRDHSSEGEQFAAESQAALTQDKTRSV